MIYRIVPVMVTGRPNAVKVQLPFTIQDIDENTSTIWCNLNRTDEMRATDMEYTSPVRYSPRRAVKRGYATAQQAIVFQRNNHAWR